MMPTDHYVQVINEEEPTKAVRFGFAKEEEATAFKRDLLAMAQTHPISIVIGQYVAGEKCPANHGRRAIVAADLAASREREMQSGLDAERYRFLRNDDNWCDDGPVTWEVLGELSGTDFDKAVDDAIRALAQPNGETER